MSEVLVLNSAFQALELISIKESIVHLYTGKAYTVVESDKTISSPSITMRIPNVIVLQKYHKVPKTRVNFSKLNTIYRDNMTCQYCGKQFSMNDLTIDHIIPRSRWLDFHKKKEPVTNWLNVVCACRWCNNKKGNKLLEETDMKLLREPYIPTYMPKIVVSYNRAESKGWIPFSKFNIRLIYS